MKKTLLALAGVIPLFLPRGVIANSKFAISIKGDCNEGRIAGAKLEADFSNSQEQLSNELRLAGWNVNLLHDPGKNSKKELLDQLDRLLLGKSPAAKKGDELLIAFSTHGTSGVRHDVCLSDGTLLPVDDPDLLERLFKAKTRGVRLAFIDDSCYSGASIPILGKYGCTVTTQNSIAPSQAGFDVNRKDIGVVHDALVRLLKARREGQNLIQSITLGGNSAISMDDVYLLSLWTAARDEIGRSPAEKKDVIIDKLQHNQAQSSDFPESMRLSESIEAFTRTGDQLSEPQNDSTKPRSCVDRSRNEIASDERKALGEVAQKSFEQNTRNLLEAYCLLYYSSECPIRSSSEARSQLDAEIKGAAKLMQDFKRDQAEYEAESVTAFKNGMKVRIPLSALPPFFVSDLKSFLKEQAILMKPEERWSLSKSALTVPATGRRLRAEDAWSDALMQKITYSLCGESGPSCVSDVENEWNAKLHRFYDQEYAKASEERKNEWDRFNNTYFALMLKVFKDQDDFTQLEGGIQGSLTEVRAYQAVRDMANPARESTQCRDFTF